MLRRLMFSSLALAALATLAARPTPAVASAMANYRLTDTDVAGGTPVTEVDAVIVPAGSVAPPALSVSPLTILPGSFGFDPKQLEVFLGFGTTPTGETLEALKLKFHGSGLQPGGRLYFSLNLDPKYNGGPPTLVVPLSVNNVAIENLSTPAPSAPGGDGGGGVSTPEPLPLLLWSSLGALGLVRARAFRRRAAV